MTDKVVVPVDGNREVQQLFDKWKKLAEEGDMKFAVVLGCRSMEDVSADIAGVRGCEFAAYYGLDRIKRTIIQGLETGTAAIDPRMNSNFEPNHWVYALDQWTTGYDFYLWLLNVEIEKRRTGCKDPLKVHFLPEEGPQREDVALAHPGRKELFYNVCIPMLELFGATITKEPGGRLFDPLTMLSYRHVIKYYREGNELPKFGKPPKYAVQAVRENLKGRKPVVLTLREAGHNAYRNNKLETWVEFAKWLQDQGEYVIFVRDTAKAEEPVEGFETCPGASKDFYIRYVLYHNAKCCFFGSNGPHGLVAISDIPWATVYPLDNNKAYIWNNPDKWTHSFGIQPGEQLPWATPHQKIILKPDTLENLIEAWHAVGLQK